MIKEATAPAVILAFSFAVYGRIKRLSWGGPKGSPVFFDSVAIDGKLSLDHLILEGNAFRIVRLEPQLGGFGIGEGLGMIGMANAVSGVHVTKRSLVSLQFAASPEGLNPEILARDRSLLRQRDVPSDGWLICGSLCIGFFL